MCVDLLPGEQCFCSVLLPGVQCCIIAWTSITVIRAPGWVSCASCYTRLLPCVVFRPSCVMDVVVGVGLALAVHPPVVCLAIFDSS